MRLKYHYNYNIKNDLITKFHYNNPMQLGRIKRIILKTSLNDTIQQHKKILLLKIALENITAQSPKNILAKKSVANFKLKKGVLISCKTTLRKNQLYNFLNKLIILVFPKIKDFSGLKLKNNCVTNSITFGLKNIQSFLEIEQQYNKFLKPFGVDINIKTNTKHIKQQTTILTSYQIPCKYI